MPYLNGVCGGCQPQRASNWNKHKSSAKHFCQGNCNCGSCNSNFPIAAGYTEERYKSWMGLLGDTAIEGANILGGAAIDGFNILTSPLKPKPVETKEGKPGSGEATKDTEEGKLSSS